MDNNMATKV